MVFVEFIEVQDVNEYLALKSEENGHGTGQRPLKLSLFLSCHDVSQRHDTKGDF